MPLCGGSGIHYALDGEDGGGVCIWWGIPSGWEMWFRVEIESGMLFIYFLFSSNREIERERLNHD